MFTNDHRKHRSLLCLDIGTASINASVFEEQDDELQLKGVSLVNQQRDNIQAGNVINLAQTIECVQEAVRQAENKAKISSKDLIIGLSGELVKGTTLTLTKNRETPEKAITGQELRSILYELQWEAFDQIRGDVAEELSLNEIELKLINASVISIKIDGVEVTDPTDMNGEKIQMEIFNCFAPIEHFGHIQNIAVELPYHELKGVFIQSFAICHSLSLQDALASCIVIDIGAGTTDICVMIDGHIIGNRSFALAGNTLTKRIAFQLSTSLEESEWIKINYSTDSLERRSQRVISEALQSDIDIWLSSLEFALNELPIKKLPTQFLLCGKGSLLPEFRHAIKDHDWEHHFPFEGEIEVRQLDYSDLLSGDFDPDQFAPEFLPLVAVANTASDLLYNNSSIDQILNSIIADKGL